MGEVHKSPLLHKPVSPPPPPIYKFASLVSVQHAVITLTNPRGTRDHCTLLQMRICYLQTRLLHRHRMRYCGAVPTSVLLCVVLGSA